MNRQPRPRMMHNVHGNPRPRNGQWRPNRPPNPHFLRRPDTSFGGPRTGDNNDEYWCETCDRGFPTSDLLLKHKQQHQKCNIDGCQFIAHPKIITMHIQMQHSSGLYKKIANLNNPEEIAKWREERRKKFPTKANIEKKAAEHAEKVKRGEKMALKHGHRKDMKNKSSDHRGGIKRVHNFANRNNNNRPNRNNNISKGSSLTPDTNKPPPKKVPKLLPSLPATVEKNKLKPFAGILNIVMEEKDNSEEALDYSNGLFEDEDEDLAEVPKNHANSQNLSVCGALTSLMCDYGSSDEETVDKQDKSSDTTVPSSMAPLSNENCIMECNNVTVNKTEVNESKEGNNSDDEGPEEVKIVKPVEAEENTAEVSISKHQKESKVVPKNNPPRNDQKHNKVKSKIPSTLLQKLLHKEIRHERNVVLQCIRYIRKNNYFDKQ